MSDQMLKDWAWRLERAIHSGHHCDATIAADAVMQSIKAELKRRATAAPVCEHDMQEGYGVPPYCKDCGYTAAPVVVGEVTDAMVTRALNAHWGVTVKSWGPTDRDAMRAALIAALAWDQDDLASS